MQPVDIEKIQLEISTWSKENLNNFGRYLGLGPTRDKEMTRCGFPYEAGESVPFDRRYSAMLEWRRAYRAMLAAERTRRGEMRG